MERNNKLYSNLPSEIIYIDESKLSKYISSSKLTIHDAMEKLNDTIELFQIIVDENNGFLGTLTDGDIRRGLLSGYNINENVSKCMNSKALLGEHGEEEKNVEKLRRVDREPLFLPIVNKDLFLEGLLIKNTIININHALIVAGGMGSRLGNLTKNTPKPMLKIKGIPIIEHCIQKLEEANINIIYVTVNHMSEQIIDFINNKKFKAQIIPIKEESKLGTIGSLYLIKDKIQFPLLVMNADLMTSLSISTLVSFYRAENVDGVIAAATYETKVPYGVLRYNALGQLERIDEKPISKNLVAAGVYILNQNISKLVNKEEFLDMPELLDKAIRKGYNIAVFPIHEKWKDIGKPEDYYDAKDSNE